MINEILIVLIIALYAFNFSLLKRKIKLVEHKNINSNNLIEVLTELSLNMNNQVLEFYNSNKSIFKLIKYQIHNKWGIKLLLENIVDEKRRDILQIFPDNQIDDISDNMTEIDLCSNIDAIGALIVKLLNIFDYKEDTSNLSCVFLKRSVLTK